MFVAEIAGIQPNQGAIKLFGEVLEDVWSIRQKDAMNFKAKLQTKMQRVTTQRDRLDEALLYKKTITQETYERQSQKLTESLTDVRMELG